MEKYIVEFKLYHYNSGAADNGTYVESIDCDTLEEAKSIKERIDKIYHSLGDDKLISEDDQNWIENIIYEHTACGGLLKSTAEIYLITKTKL